jgi:CheY-like chemotaxis protein
LLGAGAGELKNEATYKQSVSALTPRVLVVDDDLLVLKSLKLLLGTECEVSVASSPLEALELAAATQFHVVITDFRMPEMNGAELAHALKERLTAPPYCILLTGLPHEVNSLVDGAQDLVMVLGKPFDPKRMVKMVLEVGRLSATRRGQSTQLAASN